MSHSINISVDTQSTYPVYAAKGLHEEMRAFFESNYSQSTLFIVIDERVNRLHGNTVQKLCGSYFNSCPMVMIPEGEASKSLEQWQKIVQWLLQHGAERSTPLLAVGGGVTGDLAGYAAASTLRGMPLIHMPTSLLAMVDSSIGGKTGINYDTGKNLIGVFYQPDAVFADIGMLLTLDRSEWVGGMAEMIKYAAIHDPSMFDALEKAAQTFEPTEEWARLIRKSQQVKAKVVQADVHEAGQRAFLNFGHTFGHALEKVMGYGNISHGEAVYTGMLAAAYYSRQLGAPVHESRFAPFLEYYSIELPDEKKIDTLVERMRYDKKVKDGVIRLILLDDWGKPRIETCRDLDLVKEAWKASFDMLGN